MTAFVLGITFFWSHLATATGPSFKSCQSDHGGALQAVSAPDQLLFQLDGNPAGQDQLKQEQERFKQNPNDPFRQLSLALVYLKQADSKRWDYLEIAKKHFSKAMDAFPSDPFVLMYLGRTTGAQALNMEPSVLSRLRLAREGFRLMDKAVKLKPDCMWLRLLRGEAQLMAHPILRRGDRLEEDAEAISVFMVSDQFAQLNKYQQAKMHLFLGCYYQKIKSDNEAIKSQWVLAQQKGSTTEVGTEAGARLSGRWQELGYEGDE